MSALGADGDRQVAYAGAGGDLETSEVAVQEAAGTSCRAPG